MATPATAPLDNVLSTYAARTVTRFKEGYQQARFVSTIGMVSKFVAIPTGIGVAFFAIMGSETIMRPNPAMVGMANFQVQRNVFTISAILFGLLVAFVFWVCGALISAYGGHLKATLDGAVNGSPFLNDSQRAEVMRLKD